VRHTEPDQQDQGTGTIVQRDYRNRLVKVEHSDDYGEETPTWSTVVEYYYDGLNRRVKKDLATGADVVYLYDGWQVLEEREYDAGDAQILFEYHYEIEVGRCVQR